MDWYGVVYLVVVVVVVIGAGVWTTCFIKKENMGSRDIHKLKTVPKHFQKVWDRKKLFEIRKNDRNFKKGDLLVLREYFGLVCFAEEKNLDLHTTTKEIYSGREIVARVTGVFDVSDCFKNTVVLTIKVLKKRNKGLRTER